ncbi:Trehalose-6-P synthase/phosphatase complex subunit, partial [Coemansia spiralis]
MEPRVLVVSLFAPYSVSFGTTPRTPSSGGQQERPLARSGSVGRNAMWNGRRSSMYRTHTTPLGRCAEPHSRRRSTFSVNSVKLSPISRTSPKSLAEDAGQGNGQGGSSPGNEAAPQSRAHVPDDCAGGDETLCIADKPGPSQLAFEIEEAAGVHTPPANTLDFTRKLNLEQMREKQQRKAGVGRRDSLLRECPPPHRASDGAAAGQQAPSEPLEAAIAGLQITNRRSGMPLIVAPGADSSDVCSEEQFTVEHLNIGNIGLFNAVNASLDHFAERVWIGELGISTDGWSDERKEAVASKLLDDFETVPVFVSDDEFEGHYGRFSKQQQLPLPLPLRLMLMLFVY